MPKKNNKVKFGLCNVHIAPITEVTGEKITYGTPFAIPGAVNLTLDPEGENADFNADNIRYFSSSANNGYSGSLEMALITDKFRTEVLGETTDEKGAMFEGSDDIVKDFALGFQIDGDQSNRKYWFYNVSAQRPSTTGSTTEGTKEPSTDTLNITASPRATDKKVRVYLEPNDENTTEYDEFFNSVYEGTMSA